MRRPWYGFGLCTIAFIVLLSQEAHADTLWVGSDGSWFVGSNWDTGTVPTNEIVRITNGGTARIANGLATAGHLSVRFSSVGSHIDRLIIENNGELRLPPETSSQLWVGRVGTGAGQVIVRGAGSRISFVRHLRVAEFCDGLVSIEDGGSVSAQTAYIGYDHLGAGTLTVIGTGSTLNISDQLIVGTLSGADGTVNLLNGGSLSINAASPSDSFVGYNSGATGTMNVSGTQFTVEKTVALGAFPGAMGTVRVTGSNSTWTSNAPFVIGYQGAGTLEVLSGGVFNANDAFVICDQAGSSGNVLVSGPNAVLSIDPAINCIVAGAGIGSIRVENGAMVTSGGIVAGNAMNSHGTVTVSGANSVWNASALFAGTDVGAGELRIEAGGRVNLATGLYLGNDPGSQGSAIVSGVGSLLNSITGIAVGDSDSGSLTVEDGGTLSCDEAIVVGFNGPPLSAVGALAINGSINHRGLVSVATVSEGMGSGTVDFDGGILGARTNNAPLLLGFEPGEVTINSGGAYFDTNGLSSIIPISVDGTGPLVKTGAGTLTLTATNSHTGGTTVDAGTLVRQVAGAFPNNTPYTVNGGLLDLANIPLTASSLSGAGGTIDTGGIVLTVNQSGNTIYEGRIVSNGLLVKRGAGSLILTGDSTYAGGTHIRHGTLAIGAGGSISHAANDLIIGQSTGDSGVLTIASGATVSNRTSTLGAAVGCDGTVTMLGGEWTNTGSLIIGETGSGVVTLAGGSTNVAGGSGIITLANSAGSQGALHVGNGGAPPSLAASQIIGGAGTATVNFNHSGGLLVFGQRLMGNLGVSHSGTGTTLLTGNNSFTGGVTVSAGTLRAGVASAFPAISYMVNGGILDGNGFILGMGALSGTGGEVSLHSAPMTINQATNTSFLGIITGTSASLTKQGAGTLALGGTNSYFGGTLLEGGVLSVAANAGLGASFGSLTLSGGTLRATTGFSMNRPTTLSSGGGTIDVLAGTLTQQAAVTGTAGLSKIGPGTLELRSTSSYTGITTVNGGALAIADGVILTTGGVHVADVAGSSGTVDVAGTLNGGAFITVGDNATGAGAGGTGIMNINAGGVVTMNAGARYTVGWVNADGTVNLNTGGRLEVGGTDGIQKHSSGVSHFNLAGGTIRVVNSHLTCSVPLTCASGSSTIDTNGFDALLSGNLNGAGGIIKSGTGTLTLGGVNTYAGTTTVNAGTLLRSASSGFPSNAPYVVNGGTLNLSGSALTVSSLGGAGGTVAIGNATLTVDQNGASNFVGSITGGTGSFRKFGTGTLTLSGNSSYSGGNIVGGGVLNVLGSLPGPMIVQAPATLTGSGIGSINGPTQIQSGATLSPGTGPGTFTVHGLVSLEGTLRVDLTGPIAGGAGYDQFVVTSGDVTLTSSANLTFGTLTGSYGADPRLYILSNSGAGALNGTFAALPDSGASGTPVPALAGFGGFAEWRIFYHANSATNLLTGGNDVALAAAGSACPCPGEMNGDTSRDADDIQAFVACVIGGGDCGCADIDGVNGVTIDDVDDFVAAVLTGSACQ